MTTARVAFKTIYPKKMSWAAPDRASAFRLNRRATISRAAPTPPRQLPGATVPG